MQFEDDNWYLMRRNAQTDAWHPATDNALGSEAYGTAQNNPLGSDTFSLQYDTLPWTKILFAWGNLEAWVMLERSVLESFIANAGCENCVIDILKKSSPDEITAK